MDTIMGCIVALIAVLLAVYVSFTARKKGPVFSNTYLWASKEERERTKNDEYRLVTIVFGCLALVFALLSLYIFTSWAWANILMWILIVCVVVFAIADSVKTVTEKIGRRFIMIREITEKDLIEL